MGDDTKSDKLDCLVNPFLMLELVVKLNSRLLTLKTGF